MSDDLHPLPVLERLHDVRGHGDAADRFDIAAGNGLLVRNDREGLHDRARISGGLFRCQALEKRLQRRRALEAPAARDLHEFDLAAVPFGLQFVEQLAHRFAVERRLEQPGQLRDRHRLAGHQQRGLEDALDFGEVAR